MLDDTPMGVRTVSRSGAQLFGAHGFRRECAQRLAAAQAPTATIMKWCRWEGETDLMYIAEAAIQLGEAIENAVFCGAVGANPMERAPVLQGESQNMEEPSQGCASVASAPQGAPAVRLGASDPFAAVACAQTDSADCILSEVPDLIVPGRWSVSVVV